MGAAFDTMRRVSAKPVWLESPVITKATREAGLTLYEILGMAELMRVAYEKGEMESVQNRLALLMSEAANLSSTLSNILELSMLEMEHVTTMYCYFDIIVPAPGGFPDGTIENRAKACNSYGCLLHQPRYDPFRSGKNPQDHDGAHKQCSKIHRKRKDFSDP
jgi:hypothetical protein